MPLTLIHEYAFNVSVAIIVGTGNFVTANNRFDHLNFPFEYVYITVVYLNNI